MQTSNCLNCGQNLSGSFCSQCGQKETHRYTVSHVLHELVHVFTHADKGIFSFAKNILLKPGIVALDLVEGRRKRYFNLFQYLLLIVGVTTFLMVKTDFVGYMLKGMNEANGLKMSGRQASIQADAILLLQKYNNVFQMMLIPFYALFGWLFLARKRNHNFAESIVIHTASSAQTNTLAILTTSVFFLAKNSFSFMLVTVASLAIMIFSFTLCYRQFFKLSIAKSLLYGVLVFACTYIVQILLTGIVVFLYVALFK